MEGEKQRNSGQKEEGGTIKKTVGKGERSALEKK